MEINIFTLIVAEIVATMTLILLGNGIVQGVNIKAFAPGKIGSWTAIYLAWGLAVMTALLVGSAIHTGGATLNPAAAMAMVFSEAAKGFSGTLIFGLFIARVVSTITGAFLGQLILDFINYRHLQALENDALLSTHATVPVSKNDHVRNLVNEFLGTTILLLAASGIAGSAPGLDYVLVGFIVAAIVCCMGGPTGAAINPARDLGPRLVYALLSFEKKTSAHWEYSYVPIVAPLLAGVVVGLANNATYLF